jgi:hypothetical protein
MHADWLSSLSGLCRNEDSPAPLWEPDGAARRPAVVTANRPRPATGPAASAPLLLAVGAVVAVAALALVIPPVLRTFFPGTRYRW